MDSPPVLTKELLQARLPRIQAASRRLQNATEVHNDDAWPTPSNAAHDINQLTYAANVTLLDEAIQGCKAFGVDMNRLSEMGEVLDNAVEKLEKRTKRPTGKKCMEKKGATKAEREENGRKDERGMTISDRDRQRLAESKPEPQNGFVRAGSEVSPIIIKDTPLANEKRVMSLHTSDTEDLRKRSDSGDRYPKRQESVANVIKQGRSSEASGRERTVHGQALLHEAGDHTADSLQETPRFPDPYKMAGSFTDAFCQYENLVIQPILSLTLKDVTPLMVLPNRERCIVLKHFEVGLDDVEALIAGEVIIPESPFWRKCVREDRLGRLGTLKSGSGGYSRELEDHQRRCHHHGEGRWTFFGIKFKQTREEKEKGSGRWGCFGAPFEAVQHFDGYEEQVAISGGVDIQGRDVPAHSERFWRTTAKFSSGGVPCMDVWADAGDWEDGVWVDVHTAMADNCLIVNSLYQTAEQKGSALAAMSSKTALPQRIKRSTLVKHSKSPSSPIDRMDGSADGQAERKRKYNMPTERHRNNLPRKKSKGGPLDG